MKKYGLNKSDKLCSPTAIDQLFSRGADSLQSCNIFTLMAYPLRAVWRTDHGRDTGSQVQFLISIPKKKLRHAVDRVKMRRRVREAYRLNRVDYNNISIGSVDLAFIYVANDLKDYKSIERSVCRILNKIYNEKDTEQNSDNNN